MLNCTMDNHCFLCLCKSNNRVCPYCKLYSHPKCWGKYLENAKSVFISEKEDVLVFDYRLYIQCPQCKKDVPTVRSITRSCTRLENNSIFMDKIKIVLDKIEKATSTEEKNRYYYEYFDNITKYSHILNVEGMRSSVRILLILLNDLKWKHAPYFYNSILKEEIPKSKV